jgi:hypothetical protein
MVEWFILLAIFLVGGVIIYHLERAVHYLGIIANHAEQQSARIG